MQCGAAARPVARTAKVLLLIMVCTAMAGEARPFLGGRNWSWCMTRAPPSRQRDVDVIIGANRNLRRSHHRQRAKAALAGIAVVGVENCMNLPEATRSRFMMTNMRGIDSPSLPSMPLR